MVICLLAYSLTGYYPTSIINFLLTKFPQTSGCNMSKKEFPYVRPWRMSLHQNLMSYKKAIPL